MDIKVHNIETFAGLVSAPKRHTKHKTTRAPCVKRCKGSYRADKPPPKLCPALCGLLDDYLMAVDFTNCRETDRLFSFSYDLSVCRFNGSADDCRVIWLSAWQCCIAKYP